MTFTLSFIFIVCGLIFYAFGHFAISQAKIQMKYTKILTTQMCKEHIQLLKTYRDMLKYAKEVRDPYNVIYNKEQTKPTIQ